MKIVVKHQKLQIKIIMMLSLQVDPSLAPACMFYFDNISITSLGWAVPISGPMCFGLNWYCSIYCWMSTLSMTGCLHCLWKVMLISLLSYPTQVLLPGYLYKISLALLHSTAQHSKGFIGFVGEGGVARGVIMHPFYCAWCLVITECRILGLITQAAASLCSWWFSTLVNIFAMKE